MPIVLDGTTGITAPDVDSKVNGLNYPDASSMGFRNRIINGDMRIDQRNNGASVSVPADTTVFSVDRWATYSSQASKFSMQRNAGAVTPPAGFTNYLGCTSLSAYSVTASDYFPITQSIEGFNTADLGWGAAGAQAVTLSFWVRSSLTGTFGGVLQNVDNTRSYPFVYTISAANTWEQKTVTIAGDTSGTWNTGNDRGIAVRFSLGAGASRSGTAGAWTASDLRSATGATSVVGTNGATFYITGVQLEAGSVATPFERRDYGTELALCQRYYLRAQWYGGAIADDDYSLNCMGGSFPTTMRATPSIVALGGGMDGHHGDSPGSTSGISPDSVGFVWSGSSYRSIGARASVLFVASAEL